MRPSSLTRALYVLAASVLVAAIIVSGTWVYVTRLKYGGGAAGDVASAATASGGAAGTVSAADQAALEAVVLPAQGVVLPITWGDIGMKMRDAGVIDEKKLADLYAKRGGVPTDMRRMMNESVSEPIVMTRDNASSFLNLFWAFGLSNKNDILDKGPMQDKQYGGAGNFASTGGWTLARGEAMDHYSHYAWVTLTPEQQAAVERVSKGIFRPCCGNSVYFPDCNHGMAMLGLLEMMASRGVSDDEMYRVALGVNSYWFPDTYVTIATFLKKKGMDWGSVKPQNILGERFSSGAGYQQILDEVSPPTHGSKGPGCGA